MTVTTNSVNGYTVTARATSPSHPVTPGDDSTASRSRTYASARATSTFSPLSATTRRPSTRVGPVGRPGGDAIGNDYEVDIPFVAADRYSTTIDYVAMTPYAPPLRATTDPLRTIQAIHRCT